MTNIPSATGGTLTTGANPNPPKAADIERLRAAIGAMTQQSPEAQGLMSNISGLQVRISGLLNTRAQNMDAIAAILAESEELRTPSESLKAAGLVMDAASIDAMEASRTAGLREKVENIDEQIIGLQSRQRDLFDLCCRYVPSF